MLASRPIPRMMECIPRPEEMSMSVTQLINAMNFVKNLDINQFLNISNIFEQTFHRPIKGSVAMADQITCAARTGSGGDFVALQRLSLTLHRS